MPIAVLADAVADSTTDADAADADAPGADAADAGAVAAVTGFLSLGAALLFDVTVHQLAVLVLLALSVTGSCSNITRGC